MNYTFFQIMKNGSKTYFYTTLFFPKNIRKDVFTLYAFVRTADDFVDSLPQKKTDFLKFKNLWQEYLKKGVSVNFIINSYGKLSEKYSFEDNWTKDFLNAMESDLKKVSFKNPDDTEKYMYGSAEVIGLMMAKILKLPDQSLPYAALQGKAMQYLNFIRDISEDNSLGRQYFPESILKRHKLSNLTYENARKNPNEFCIFIREEISRYKNWQMEATKGYVFLPTRYRIPIKTAAMMYNWTSDQIYKNPFIVFEKKVKPSALRIVWNVIKNTITDGKIF